MGNYANLLSVPRAEPASSTDSDCIVVRNAKNIIPLFWFGLFEEADIVEYDWDCVGPSGAPEKIRCLTLLNGRDNALESISKFAEGLNSVKGIPEPGVEYLRNLIDEIKSANGSAIQLDGTELQLLLDAENLSAWVQDGCRFADSVRAGRLKKLNKVSAELLEGSGILPELQKPVQWERFDKDEFAKKAVELAATPPPEAPEVKQPELQLESVDWEHSLIGVLATPVLDDSATSEAKATRKPWWQFWA